MAKDGILFASVVSVLTKQGYSCKHCDWYSDCYLGIYGSLAKSDDFIADGPLCNQFHNSLSISKFGIYG